MPRESGAFMIMVKVTLRPGENSDGLLRRFKDSVRMSGVLIELDRRKFYKKPSQLKHECLSKRKSEEKKIKRRKQYR